MSPNLAKIIKDYGAERPIPCDAERWSASLADYGFAKAVPTRLFDAIVENGNQIAGDVALQLAAEELTRALGGQCSISARVDE